MRCIGQVSKSKMKEGNPRRSEKVSTTKNSKTLMLFVWLKFRKSIQHLRSSNQNRNFTWRTAFPLLRKGSGFWFTTIRRKSRYPRITKSSVNSSNTCSQSWKSTKAETTWDSSLKSLSWRKSNSRKLSNTSESWRTDSCGTKTNIKKSKDTIKS